MDLYQFESFQDMSSEIRQFISENEESSHSAASAEEVSMSSTKSKQCKLLSLDFMPSPYTVVLGKGNTPRNVVGNRRLRILASVAGNKYARCKSRKEKSNVITELFKTVQTACPTAAFVKFQDGRWWEVDDDVAREKIGYILRDLLHDRYKSSSKSKTANRRRQTQGEEYKDASSTLHVHLARKPGHHFLGTASCESNCESSQQWPDSFFSQHPQTLMSESLVSPLHEGRRVPQQAGSRQNQNYFQGDGMGRFVSHSGCHSSLNPLVLRRQQDSTTFSL